MGTYLYLCTCTTLPDGQFNSYHKSSQLKSARDSAPPSFLQIIVSCPDPRTRVNGLGTRLIRAHGVCDNP